MKQSQSHKRRYVAQATIAAGVIGLGVAGVVMSLPAQANLKAPTAKQGQLSEATDRGQEQVEDKVEASVYSQVMRLRGDIAMTNGDLAALGLNEAQAEDVLTRLVEWVETNQTALIAADNKIETARQKLALLQRRIRTGEADTREIGGLSNLHRAVADADAACKTLRVQAGTHAVAPAPGNIQSQWAQASANAHLPVDLRHVPGLDEQRLRALMGNAPPAPGTPGSGGAQTAVGGVGLIAAGLTFSEQSDRAQATTNIQTHLPGVAAAEARVLPVPTELQDDEAGMLLDEGVDE